MGKKLKILTNVSIICLSICMFAFGVYAANNVSVTSLGTVTFTATNVHASVVRTIENIDEEESTFSDINVTYDAYTEDEKQEVFDNEVLHFVNGNTDIVMIFTITNLSQEEGRNLYVTFTDINTTEANNVNKYVTSTGGEIEVLPTKSIEIEVHFRVADPNLSAMASYDYLINLSNESTAVVLDDTLATFTEIKNTNGTTTGYSLSGLKTSSTASIENTIAETVNPLSLDNIIIPETYNNLPVQEIGTSAFENNTIIKTIKIPDNITKINSKAFKGCSSLSNAVISNDSHLSELGTEAFRNCTKLATINLPSKLQSLPQQAFDGAGLVKITLPYGMENTGAGAFLRCNNLIEVNLPETIKSITLQCFAMTPSLKSMTLPNSLEKIEKLAFGYSGLETLIIPDNVHTIIETAFYLSESLHTIKLPANLTNCGVYPFNGTAIERLEIPANYTKLQVACFGDMPKLKSVTFLGEPVEFESNIFQNCTSLETIEIPDSVQIFGDYVFYECSSLRYLKLPTGLQICGKGIIRNSGLENVEIPATYVNIWEKMFEYSSNLKKVTFEGNVNSIGIKSFQFCRKLKTVEFKGTVTLISDWAFSYCDALTDIVLPSSLTSLGTYVFAASGIKTVIIPESITEIPEATFVYCVSLSSVVLHNKITSIGSSAFQNCSSLKTISFPETDHNVSLHTVAFAFTGIEGEVYLPDNYVIEGTSNSAFLESPNITGYRVNESNTKYMSIDGVLYIKNASSEPTRIELYPSGRTNTTYEIPATVTSIRRFELENSNYLQEFTLASGNTTYSVEDGILYSADKTSLVCVPNNYPNKTYTIKDGITILNVGSAAKYAEAIFIPTSVTTITGCTFQNCRDLKRVGKSGQTVSDIEEGIFDFSGLINLTKIDYKSLEYCEGMTTLKVGEKFKTFGDGCFMFASNLNKIYIYNETSVVQVLKGQYTSDDYANNFKYTSIEKIYVPDALVETYKNTECWASVKDKIYGLSTATN